MIPQLLHRLDSSGLKLAAEGSPQRTGFAPRCNVIGDGQRGAAFCLPFCTFMPMEIHRKKFLCFLLCSIGGTSG
jgi:hypothetical protein